MKKVPVQASSKSYEVIIGAGILDDAGSLAASVIKPCKAAIITDDIVDELYSARLADSLESAGFSTIKYVIKNGEESKSPENLIKIVNFLAENQLTANDAVFALGGGVIGDISGLSAAVFLRGVKLIQLPTTLLSAVDSSVGGKTAVNLDAGKNLMGAFYQPDMVICDYTLFDTLPEFQFANGMAEVIKYGMIFDREFLDVLKSPVKENIEEVIAHCVQIKSHIVSIDEKDTGERKLLNFGHTFGHAIEKCSNFEIPHGNAVAIGMAMITGSCIRKGICDSDSEGILLELLKMHDLPNESDFSKDDLYEALLHDKKRRGNSISLVVPETAGKCVLKKVDIEEVRDYL